MAAEATRDAGLSAAMTMAGKDFVQVPLHLLVLRVPLRSGRVEMMPAERAVLFDEGDVHLGQRSVEGTILPPDDVVGHKPPSLHAGR